MENQTASVVITHQILDGKKQEFENWLDLYIPTIRLSEGFIDVQIVKPVPGITFIYTTIVRFDTAEHLKDWMESPERLKLIDKATPLFVKGEKEPVKYGLDFLFSNKSTGAPVRWKQFLATWSAVYPLSLLITTVEFPLLRYLKIPDNRFLDSFISTGCLIFMLVFVVMPHYTKLIQKWLYK